MADISRISMGGVEYDIRDKVLEAQITHPDEEDITSEGKLLKLKDRPANDGMGYVILRKNKTFAEQVTKENTIYEVRYDFDLDGVTHEIPNGSILKFVGGSLSNGALIGVNTQLLAAEDATIFKSIIISGTWKVRHISQTWFDFVKGPQIDNSQNFANLIALTSEDTENFIYFDNGDYHVDISRVGYGIGLLRLKSNTSLFLGDTTIRVLPNAINGTSLISITEATNVIIKGGVLVGDARTHLYAEDATTAELNHGINIKTGCKRIRVEGTICKEFTGDGFDIIDSGENEIEDIYFHNVIADSNNRQGLSIEAGKRIRVTDCRFLNSSTIHNTLPGSGIDIEPWTKGVHINDIVIERCEFVGNVGRDIMMQVNINEGEDEKWVFDNDINVIGCKLQGDIYVGYCNNVKLESITNRNLTIEKSTNISLKKAECIGWVYSYSVGNVYVDSSEIEATLNIDTDSDYISVRNSQLNEILYVASNDFEVVGCKCATLSVATETGLVKDSEVTKLSMFGGANMRFHNNIISNNAALTMYSQEIVGNIFNVPSVELGWGCTFKENTINLISDSVSSYAIRVARQGATFSFIRNRIRGAYSYMVERRYGTEVIEILNEEYIAPIEWFGGFTPLEGCKALNKGSKCQYVNGEWVYEPTITTSDVFPANPYIGMPHFSKSANRPYWWNGSNWVDATGATV